MKQKVNFFKMKKISQLRIIGFLIYMSCLGLWVIEEGFLGKYFLVYILGTFSWAMLMWCER